MSKELISYLKLIHGSYNSLVILLFVYQGSLGLRIRRADKKPSNIVGRHRKIGPVAAISGIIGFFAGMTIAYLDSGRILKNTLHFSTGLLIVSLIVVTYIISGRIRSPDPLWRNRHFALGILIICLYFVQAFLGLGILL